MQFIYKISNRAVDVNKSFEVAKLICQNTKNVRQEFTVVIYMYEEKYLILSGILGERILQHLLPFSHQPRLLYIVGIVA